MKTLYIIGNGFDIAHKLDTSYWDFRVYLARTYPEFLQEFEHMYNIEQFDPSSPRVSAGAYKQWHIDSPFCLIFARNKRFSHAYADSACPAMAVGSAAKTGLAASCDHS